MLAASPLANLAHTHAPHVLRAPPPSSLLGQAARLLVGELDLGHGLPQEQVQDARRPAPPAQRGPQSRPQRERVRKAGRREHRKELALEESEQDRVQPERERDGNAALGGEDRLHKVGGVQVLSCDPPSVATESPSIRSNECRIKSNEWRSFGRDDSAAQLWMLMQVGQRRRHPACWSSCCWMNDHKGVAHHR
jgi:hypothetical protein